MNILSYLAPLIVAATLPGVATAGATRISVNIPFGADTVLISNKTVSINAKCDQNEGGIDIVRVYGKTTVNNSTVQNGFIGNDFDGNGGNFLTPATVPDQAILLILSTATGQTVWSGNFDTGYILDTNPSKPSKMAGLVFDAESTVLGITPNGGCYISLGVEKINNFKVPRHP